MSPTRGPPSSPPRPERPPRGIVRTVSSSSSKGAGGSGSSRTGSRLPRSAGRKGERDGRRLGLLREDRTAGRSTRLPATGGRGSRRRIPSGGVRATSAEDGLRLGNGSGVERRAGEGPGSRRPSRRPRGKLAAGTGGAGRLRLGEGLARVAVPAQVHGSRRLGEGVLDGAGPPGAPSGAGPARERGAGDEPGARRRRPRGPRPARLRARWTRSSSGTLSPPASRIRFSSSAQTSRATRKATSGSIGARAVSSFRTSETEGSMRRTREAAGSSPLIPRGAPSRPPGRPAAMARPPFAPAKTGSSTTRTLPPPTSSSVFSSAAARPGICEPPPGEDDVVPARAAGTPARRGRGGRASSPRAAPTRLSQAFFISAVISRLVGLPLTGASTTTGSFGSPTKLCFSFQSRTMWIEKLASGWRVADLRGRAARRPSRPRA